MALTVDKPTVFPNGIKAIVVDEDGNAVTGAQQAAIADLTDSTSGTTDGELADVSTAVTGVDGAGDNAASKEDVDARLVAINNNIAELNESLDAIKAALRAYGVIAS